MRMQIFLYVQRFAAVECTERDRTRNVSRPLTAAPPPIGGRCRRRRQKRTGRLATAGSFESQTQAAFQIRPTAPSGHSTAGACRVAGAVHAGARDSVGAGVDEGKSLA